MMKDILLVALGGAIGSALRYACSLGVAHMAWHPTIATLIVNVLGSFLIGLVISTSPKGSWNLLASVGFCGGFTTFSTFSYQSLSLIQGGKIGAASGYILTTMAVCLIATWLGVALGKTFVKQ